MENDQITFWEQPEKSEQAQENIVKENESEGAKGSLENGSQFGKFSSAEELLNAYNSLQAEFTRKCQKLSEIQKQNAEKEINETSLKKDEPQNISPAFEQENWQSEVAKFLLKNDTAKEFSREISNEILKDKTLQNSPNMLEIAWARVISKNYKSPKELATEKSFMNEYVLSNENIKKQVIGDYLKELKKAPPVIGSGIRGGGTLFAKSNKPSSLSDAKILAEKLFKN